MNLPQLCIRRPVFTIAITLVLVIIGIISFMRLPVREFPRMDKPVISIYTEYTGASASLIENDVTTPIENAIAGVSGIVTIRSKSREGSSYINIEFGDNYDINVAMNDVRDKLSRIIKSLPEGTKTPIISKNDSDSNRSIVVAVTDTKRNTLQLTDYIERTIEPLMQQVEGVSNVNIWGQRAYAMRIWLNPTKMASQSVTVNDIVDALKAQNINVPAGEIKSTNRNYPVIANAGLKNAAEFNDLIVRDQNGIITRFKDVAHIAVAAENIDSAFRIDGRTGLALGIVPESTANPINVSHGVRKAMREIKASLPPGMQVKVVYDSANFINLSIHEVYRSLVEALILVVIIVFLFLGSIRSTLIPVVTIPVCLITIFAGLYFFAYSINTITLLALVLAIGLVVDDAIVMLENIYRHIEQGMAPFAAALAGSKEIVFAIIAMTLTLVAVYLPIAFTQGLTGILFRQFALTLAGTVTISGFVALTLSPMMSARLLRPINHNTRYGQWLDQFIEKFMNRYRYLLTQILQRRILVIIALLILAGLGIWLYKKAPTELAPMEDRGSIMGIIQSPTNSSFNYTDRYAKQIEKIYANVPQATSYLISVDANSAFSILSLQNWDKRKLSQQQIAQQLQKKFNKIPGVNAYSVSPAPFRRHSGNQSIQIRIMSSSSYDNLLTLTNQLAQQIAKYPGLTDVDTSLKMDNQQFNIKIKRNLAADLQVSLDDISTAIGTLLGGGTISTFEFDGRNYNVILQMRRQDLKDLQGLDKIYLRSKTDKMIPLSSLINVEPKVGPVILPHYNRLRADEITAELAPGYTVGEVTNYLQKFMKMHLPSNAKYTFSGSVKDFLQSHNRMKMIFLLALAFIYLVLAAQFESFIDPFIVLLSVPLSLIGGLFVLRLAGGTLNIYSQIALVTLIGLIAKHGILITEFANQMRAQGKDIYHAVIDAAVLRLRPILMTTGAMVLGALPLALASGAGAASRQQVGWVIVGGMLFGTFFSLFVVPTAYLYLARFQRPERFVQP